jgi:hypothetical protein
MRDTTDLIKSLGLDLSAWGSLLPLPIQERGQSWFENPRLLAAHQRRRNRAKKARARLRRTRRMRGQNLRTGR